MSKPLPESVRLIAEVIGEDLAFELIRRLPRITAVEHPAGRPVLSVPKNLKPDHRFVEWVGWDAASKLSKIFGGELIFVATCSYARKAPRNSEILAALKSASPAVVAHRFSISERQVRRIAAAARADVPAMGLQQNNADYSRMIPSAMTA